MERQRKFDTAIVILTFTAVTLRSEVALLLGPLAVQGLILRRTTFLSLIKTGMISGMLSLGWTVAKIQFECFSRVMQH